MFCQLEKDEKTYNLSKKYLSFLKNNNKNCVFIFENELQRDEIKQHLILNKTSKDLETYEAEIWIKNHANNFRIYLNSIKILTLMIHVKEEEYTYELFAALVDKYNNCKKIIECIF